MAKTTENRIRKLERNHRPPPYREASIGYLSEEEFVALIALGRAAMAGDTAAEARFKRALAAPPLSTRSADRLSFDGRINKVP